MAVVTGAGRGLGRLYALELARRGASVVVNDLGGTMQGQGADPSVADEVVKEIEGAGGAAVASHESVASPEGGQAIIRSALDHFGRLDAVVSNAGIFQTHPFEELTVDDWRQMIGVHLDGAFHLARAAFPVMRQEGYGRFVFIASSAGLFGQMEAAHYAAAKAGIFGLANVISLEGAQHGVLANTVLPFGYSRMVTETVGEREQFVEELSFLHAIEPDLVVPLVAFLASHACSFSHRNYSAAAGRYARVFVGLGQGWLAPKGACPTAEDIATNLDAVSATEPFIIPTSIYDEVGELCQRLGIF